MTALYIISGLILLILAIMLIKVTFRITYCQKVILCVKIGFYKLKLEPSPKDHEKQPKEPKKTKEKPKKKKAEEAKPKPKPSVKEIFEIIRETTAELASRFKRHIRLERYVVKINVASDEPDKTAVLYGAVSASAANLYRFISTIKKRPKSRERFYSEVTPDFISEEFDFYADIALSLRVWQLFHIGMTAVTAYFKFKRTSKEKGK